MRHGWAEVWNEAALKFFRTHSMLQDVCMQENGSLCLPCYRGGELCFCSPACLACSGSACGITQVLAAVQGCAAGPSPAYAGTMVRKGQTDQNRAPGSGGEGTPSTPPVPPLHSRSRQAGAGLAGVKHGSGSKAGKTRQNWPGGELVSWFVDGHRS